MLLAISQHDLRQGTTKFLLCAKSYFPIFSPTSSCPPQCPPESIYQSPCDSELWSGILLLHGLLVDGDGILGYVLMECWWRVDYGLDPRRTLLAVAFLAKVTPPSRLAKECN
ncbi:hypothetical protein H4582DRAFT_1908389 [Lactarius indigo]|nr:hypothetical protein H4582DRAFT_1908389 [Lactarius indigo]